MCDYTAKDGCKLGYVPSSLRQRLILRSTDYFYARRTISDGVIKSKAVTDRVIISACIALTGRQHQLLVTLLLFAPVERVAVHGDLVEAKVVIYGQPLA